LGFAILTAVAYWFILRHTRAGLEMRAAVDGYQLARIRGVKLSRVSRIAWVMSFVSAGLVGVCGSILLGLDSDSYLVLLFVAAAATVIGGLRSVPWPSPAVSSSEFSKTLSAATWSEGCSRTSRASISRSLLGLLGGLWLMSRRRGRVAGTAATASDAPVELIPAARSWRYRGVILIFVAVACFVYFDLSASSGRES